MLIWMGKKPFFTIFHIRIHFQPLIRLGPKKRNQLLKKYFYVQSDKNNVIPLLFYNNKKVLFVLDLLQLFIWGGRDFFFITKMNGIPCHEYDVCIQHLYEFQIKSDLPRSYCWQIVF